MDMFLFELIGIVILVFLSAFFASAETAYTGLTLSQLKRVQRLKPGALKLWEKSPDRVLAALLLSNNAVNMGVGVLAAALAANVSNYTGWPISLTTLLFGLGFAIVVLVIGEIIPKVWAKRYAVSWSLQVTPLMTVWSRLISPISQAAVGIIHWLSSNRLRKKSGNLFIQQDELRHILTHTTIPVVSRKILNKVLEFSNAKAADVMTHRSDIFAVSMQQPMEKIILGVIQSGFSRVPIYSGSLDNIQGIIYSKDLLVAWRSGGVIVLNDLIRPVHYVRSTMPVPDLLKHFKSGRRQHLALVNDETSRKRIKGLVTIQDALETLVGEIREEV